MTDVFTSVTLTRAVGIAPPPESVTVPSKVALTACPNEHVAVQSASAKRLTHKSRDQRALGRAPRHFRDSIRPSDRRQYTPGGRWFSARQPPSGCTPQKDRP